MAAPEGSSRVIAWLKILLPLMALAILSTVFLVAHRVDPVHEINYRNIEIAELAGQQMIRNPRYSGVTGNGVAVRLAATSALPEMTGPGSALPDRLQGREAKAEVDIPDGERIDVYADDLDLDVWGNLATFGGGVRIESSNGYVLGTETIRLALDAARMSSDTLTTLSAPIGRIVAHGFNMRKNTDSKGNYVLVFNGGVKMLFEPGK